MVLLDTCSLLWWTMDPGKLSEPAAKACEDMQSAGGFVSSISVWEIAIKIKKCKLEIGLPVDEFVLRIKKTRVVSIIPVDENVWLENVALPWDHADPADRTIVATARLRGLTLITPDRAITSFYNRCIW